MPTYSYQCKRCNTVKDVFHPMSVRPRVACDACGGPCARLLGTGAGIIFKGSGFYETDYKRKASGDPGKAETPAASKGDGAASKPEPASSKREPASAGSGSEGKSAAKSG